MMTFTTGVSRVRLAHCLNENKKDKTASCTSISKSSWFGDQVRPGATQEVPAVVQGLGSGAESETPYAVVGTPWKPHLFLPCSTTASQVDDMGDRHMQETEALPKKIYYPKGRLPSQDCSKIVDWTTFFLQ